MATSDQDVDICIVCALEEEVRAFLNMAASFCDGKIEHGVSSAHGYSFHRGSLVNKQGEALTLHISWLVRNGPQEMVAHLKNVLGEVQPRLVVMTGICAGDRQRVKLGDLVVAERTYTFDNGRFGLDAQGRVVHEHDTLTYQCDSSILSFLQMFDGWEQSVQMLPRPEGGLRDEGAQPKPDLAVTRYIKPMASGSAVRKDRPFAEVQKPVRDTVAIDMEGAAMGLGPVCKS